MKFAASKPLDQADKTAHPRGERSHQRALDGAARPNAAAHRVHKLQLSADHSASTSPVAQLQKLANSRPTTVLQRRPVTETERTRLVAAQEKVRKGVTLYKDLKRRFAALDRYGGNHPQLASLGTLRSKVEEEGQKVEELDRVGKLGATASSHTAFERFEKKANHFEHSGGKNALLNARKELDRRERASLQDQRDKLTEVTGLDEVFFEDYLKSAKSPVRVYRGDGRGVDAHSLDGFNPHSVKAGGTPDISFYGVVEHTHTSTAKNGMVSTTPDVSQAKSWATDDHTFGIVYEFELTRYIDIARLLAQRNFKNRFAGQLEILTPGDVPASAMVAATLYKKSKSGALEPIKRWPAG